MVVPIYDVPHLAKRVTHSIGQGARATGSSEEDQQGGDEWAEGDSSGSRGDPGGGTAADSNDGRGTKRRRPDHAMVQRGRQLVFALLDIRQQRRAATLAEQLQLLQLLLDPDHLLLYLLKKLDDQFVPAAVLCLIWQLLQDTLDRLGFHSTALHLAVWGSAFKAMDQSGSSNAQRGISQHHQAVMLLQPGATLPAFTAGYPTRLLLAAALNPESRLHLVDCLPEDRRSSLNERSQSSDSAEGQFAGIKSRAGGVCPTAAVLASSSGTMDWMCLTQALPEDERGFALAGVSKVYEAAEAGSAKDVREWNGAQALFSPVAASAHFSKLAKKVGSKVRNNNVLVSRDVHKKMRD